jgi:N-acetylglutamate synthase-like GNAT family acetyltransferase
MTSPKVRITHRRESIDFKQVRLMLKDSYWVPGISLRRVRGLADHSFLVAALVDNKAKVYAYARVVSDGSRFAYLADVIVHPEYRGQGLGKRVVASLLNHRRLVDVDQWLLQTRDAHKLYDGFGFHALEFPERVMVRRKRDKIS